MEKSEDYLADRILWRAKRIQCPSKTVLLFEDVDSAIHDKFQNAQLSHTLGRPVLYFEGEQGKWSILSTDGILTDLNGTLETILFSEIADHNIGDDPFNNFSGGVSPKKIKFRKSRQHKILIRKKDGQETAIHAKRGNDIYTLYNLLIMMLRMKQK